MPRFLIIQTAFIGDVVLATALAEKLHKHYPEAVIDFLVRKGNEHLLHQHPYIHSVLVWDKQSNKHLNLARIIRQVRRNHYDFVINPHRFATSGLITMLSGATERRGFDKNPFAFGFSRKIPHPIRKTGEKAVHEVERNQMLIADITDQVPSRPALYPSEADVASVQKYAGGSYICIAPTSVWYTKQYPVDRWIDLINRLPASHSIYLLGAPSDTSVANEILHQSSHSKVVNLCGQLTFLQSAALMRHAEMNYVNDSAPMHFASAVNAPVTAVFCSTVPAFGFGPLSDQSEVVEIDYDLYCRPCGLHGYKTCPEGHFKCARDINQDQFLWWISKKI